MTNVFFPPEGGTIVLNYSIKPCGGEKNITFQKSASDWFSITATSTSLTITASAGSAREGYITPLLNGTACSNIIVTQGSCDCSSFDASGTSSISFDYIIPESGASVNTVIGTYTLDGCSESEIGFISDLDLIASNGEIKLGTAIPQTTNTAFTEFSVQMYYGDSAVTCFSDTILQEGSTVKCDCSGVEYFIESFKKTYPLSGTSELVMLASGSTHNCGTLSASTSDSMFDGGIDCRYNGNLFEFWGKLTSAQDIRSCAITLHYIDNYGDEQYCSETLVVVQTGKPCSCERSSQNIKFARVYGGDDWGYGISPVFFNSYDDYLNGEDALGNTIYIGPSDTNEHFILFPNRDNNWMSQNNILVGSGEKCYLIWPSSSDADWIYPARSDSWDSSGFYWKNNDTGQDRIGHITYDFYVDFDNTSTVTVEANDGSGEYPYKITSYNIRGVSKCRPITFTVLQTASNDTCYLNHKIGGCAKLFTEYFHPQISKDDGRMYFPSNPTDILKVKIDTSSFGGAVIDATTSGGNWAQVCFDEDNNYCLCFQNNNTSSGRTETAMLQVQTRSGEVCCESELSMVQHPIITSDNCDGFNTSIEYYLECQIDNYGGERIEYVDASDNSSFELDFFGDSRNYKMSAVTCDSSGVETPSNIIKNIIYHNGGPLSYGSYSIEFRYNENASSNPRTQYIKLFYVDENDGQVGNCYRVLKTIQHESTTPTCRCGYWNFSAATFESTGYCSNYGELKIGEVCITYNPGDCNSVSAYSQHSEITAYRIEGPYTASSCTLKYNVYVTIGENTENTQASFQDVTVDVYLMGDNPQRVCSHDYVRFRVLKDC